MNIKFKFQTKPDIAKAKVASELYRASFAFISLPDDVTLEFTSLGKTVYAETPLNCLAEKTIRINDTLSVEEMVEPLIHELIHLSQLHTNRLAISRTGKIIWDGVSYVVDQASMTYKEYRNLPWELDAYDRQKSLLDSILTQKS